MGVFVGGFPRKSSFSRLYYQFVTWGLDCNLILLEAFTGFPGETLLFALLRRKHKGSLSPLSRGQGMWTGWRKKAGDSSGVRLPAVWSCSLDGSTVWGFQQRLPKPFLGLAPWCHHPLADSCGQLAHVKPFIHPLPGSEFQGCW